MTPPDPPLLGTPLPGWTARPMPPARALRGAHCSLEPLVPHRHAEDLYRAFAEDDAGWTWMGYGPFLNAEAYRAWADRHAGRSDPLFFAILDRAGPAGVLALHRIQPDHGTAELGHIRFSPRLQRTTAATEAVLLMLRRLFDDLGYRRVEWKCDTLNAASRRAAERLGFTFEGIFRNHLVVKGRNRDTAWYAMTDGAWRILAPGHAAWLAEAGDGPQRRRLSDALAEAAATAS